MAARPNVVSCIRSFVDALTQWVDVPFIIVGCTERTVIFYLCFRIEVLDDKPVLLSGSFIGWQLQWDGVEEAIAARNQGAKDQEVMLHPPLRFA